METILVLDFGGKYSQLVARIVRESGAYSEVEPARKASEIDFGNYRGLVLSGGTQQDYDRFSFSQIPVLTIFQSEEKDTFVIPNSDNLVAKLLTKGNCSSLSDFIFLVCDIKEKWTVQNFATDMIEDIRKKADGKKVFCALSGGVDSSVCAVLAHKAVGENLTCLLVDHGLMRKNEADQVVEVFKNQFSINLIRVNAQDRFLGKLAGVIDPEQKRKIIGEEFIRVFEDEAKKLGEIGYLVQGTIYPDIIESGTNDGKLVKSHHNVGGLPENIEFEGLIEPLKYLFKDEVRACGLQLGIPEFLIMRQPFPGPGLGVRVIGDLTKEKLDTLRDADAIFREELEAVGLNKKINQYFAVLTNMKSVGVKADCRTYDYTVALRAVNTVDFMTAEWAPIPHEILAKVSSRIVAEVDGVNRIVYDITGKPPATIEWE